MILTDTHAHLYLDSFDQDRDALLQRASDAGIRHIFLPNIDHQSVTAMLQFCEHDPAHLHPMLGLHPTSVGPDSRQALATIFSSFRRDRFCAIGEIGIDLYWDRSYLVQQEEAFRWQLDFALEHALPVVIHMRESFDEIIRIVEDYKNTPITGIFHCFSGNEDQAARIIELGYLLGIGGVVTYKNSGLPEVVRQAGLQHLVLETDAPFLPPVPFRGKRNEPSYLVHIAVQVADILGLSVDEVAEVTTTNALKLFRINP